jgi:hypothetical protein
MATTYMIFENGQPLDGEAFGNIVGLFKTLPYADADAMVIAIDLAECIDGGSTPCRDVTEDVVVECWSWLDRSEREDLAERGHFKLASRFVADEYESAMRTVEAA